MMEEIGVRFVFIRTLLPKVHEQYENVVQLYIYCNNFKIFRVIPWWIFVEKTPFLRDRHISELPDLKQIQTKKRSRVRYLNEVFTNDLTLVHVP